MSQLTYSIRFREQLALDLHFANTLVNATGAKIHYYEGGRMLVTFDANPENFNRFQQVRLQFPNIDRVAEVLDEFPI